MRSRGVTLPEILVAMLIAGILAAIALPTFLGARDRAKDEEARQAARDAIGTVQATHKLSDGLTAGGLAARIAAAEPSLTGKLTDSTALPTVAGQGTVSQQASDPDDVSVMVKSRTGRVEGERVDLDDGRRESVTLTSAIAGAPAYTNLVYNPSVERSLLNWGGNLGPRTRTRAWAAQGRWSVNTSGTGGIDTYVETGSLSVTNSMTPISVGQPYTTSMTIRINSISGGAGVRLRMLFCNDHCQVGTSTLDTFGSYVTTPGVHELTHTVSAPPDSTFAHVRLAVAPGTTVDVDIDRVMFAQGSQLPGYFDGDSPGGRWDSIEHNSVSHGWPGD